MSKESIDRYDICLVFPAEKKENGIWDVTNTGSDYLDNLQHLGFEIYSFKIIGKKSPTLAQSVLSSCCSSKRKKEQVDEEECLIFVLFRTPLYKLREYAERTNMKLLIDPKIIDHGDKKLMIEPINIRHEPDVTPLKPSQYIYGPYKREKEGLYWKEHTDDEHPFNDIVRMKLSAVMLQSPIYFNGEEKPTENLKIARYLRYETLLGCFLLPSNADRSSLRERWSRYPFKPQPLDEIKECFGEKMALYYAFIDHYVKFLIIPAVVGFPFQITVWALNDYSTSVIPFFSLLLSIWCIIMLQYWHQREKDLALRWGMLGFRKDEQDRSEFRGEAMESHIDGSIQYYFSSKIRQTRIKVSILSTIALCGLVIGVVAGIYVIRFAISPIIGDENAQTVASILNSILIETLNRLYSFVAEVLSEWENHRTDTAFEDSMISKTFLFQFINSYASFFYLAFVAQYVGDCPSDVGCMPSLAYNLGIIFTTQYLTNLIINRIVLPYILLYYRKRDYIQRMCNGNDRNHLCQAEIEYLKDKVDGQKYFFDVYSDMALQLGYNAMFASALPMASFFALIVNALNLRTEPFIWFELRQFPLPRGEETIGSWHVILEIIARISILTNAALIVFTMDNLNGYSLIFRFWVFVLFQWCSFLLQNIAKVYLADETEPIRVQQEREKYIVGKLIYDLPDRKIDRVQRKAPLHLDYQPIPVESSLIVTEFVKIHKTARSVASVV